MYAVIEFEEKKCAIVPLLWLNNDNSQCFWPKIIKNEEAYEKLVQQNITPKPNWMQYHVKKVLFIGETYEECNKRLIALIEESESESAEDSTLILKKKVHVQLLDDSFDLSQTPTFFNTPPRSCATKEKLNLPTDSEGSQKKSKRSKKRSLTSDDSDTNKSNSSFEYDELLTRKLPIKTTENASETPTTSEISSHSRNSEVISSPLFQETASVEHHVIRDLEIIKARQEQQTLLLNELLRTMRTQTIETLRKPADMPNVPVSNKQEYKALETFLDDEEKYLYMKRRLAAIGGSNVRNTTMNILKFLISNKVAINFNWAGRDKRPFKDTKTMGIIYDAVKLAYHGNKFSVDVSDKTIATAVKDWLKLAKYRYSYEINKKSNKGTC